MARYYLSSAQAHSDEEARASVDDLIRPGLGRAFPLPTERQTDERFNRLLEALAQRYQGTG